MREFTLKQLLSEEIDCPCGRRHSLKTLREIEIGSSVIIKLPEMLNRLNVKKPFVVMGGYAKEVIGDTFMRLVPNHSLCMLPKEPAPKPDEKWLAIIRENFESDSDFILGVGSGVINDLCKMLAKEKGIPCGIVCTAPSMDGYASDSSAMELGGIKTTVYTTCPTLILCDTDIMRHAPMDMIRAGFGDMMAKHMSLAEWKMASVITGEYYCPWVAEILQSACEKVMAAAPCILNRDVWAIEALSEGLILSGMCSAFAGVSRPASSLEHTISHLLEMFALAKGKTAALHGLQVAYGVRIGLKLYPQILAYEPVVELHNFDEAEWEAQLIRVFGEQAKALISAALHEGRYSTETMQKRSHAAIEAWQSVRDALEPVADRADEINEKLDLFDIPKISEPEKLGYTVQEAKDAFYHSCDLRNRYISTLLCRDVGLLNKVKIF